MPLFVQRLRFALLVLLAPGLAGAAGPEVHALTGLRVVQAPGRVLERGTIVLRDGIVEAVGARLAPPEEARLHDREGLTAYPGLIDLFVVRPWSSEAAGEKKKEGAPAQGLHPNPLVRPGRDMACHALDPEADGKLRKAGFTTALVVPEPGLFRGGAVLVNLGEGSTAENLLRRHAAQAVRIGATHPDGGYPTSLMGSVALFRQTLLDASWGLQAREAYERDPAQRRPVLDASVEALAPVLRGERPVVFETASLGGFLRAGKLADEAGVEGILVGSGEEYRRVEAVARLGRATVLPLDFPEPPRFEEEDDLGVELDELRHWDRAPDNPRRLLEAGVTVAFTAHGLDDPSAIHASLARAIERGLDPGDALSGLTTVPAALLGVRAGAIEPGRMANLVIVEGDLFVKEPKIREVWIDGRRYEIKEPGPEGKDPEEGESR